MLHSQQRLGPGEPEADLARKIDHWKHHRKGKTNLVNLLAERHPVYQGRGARQMDRIRGYVLASLGASGLPASALPVALEELQSGRSAYLLAAAAIALRGWQQPGPQFVPFLLKAIENIRYHDNSLSFDSMLPVWPVEHSTTAMQELAKTLGSLGASAQSALPDLRIHAQNRKDFSPTVRASLEAAIATIESDETTTDQSCCELPTSRHPMSTGALGKRMKFRDIAAIELEDHAGATVTAKEALAGKPTVVGFFYTRCMNPNKCSLTINKLGQLQRALEEQGLQDQVQMAVFTYDPAYDTPDRIQAFCANRRFELGQNATGFRVHGSSFEKLQHFFQLGVNYAASVVNQHRLELFLLDHRGNVAISHVRLQWEVDAVLEDAQKLASQAAANPVKSRLRMLRSGISSVFLPMLIAVFPKCPVCWAAYLSAVGIASLERIPYSPWLVVVAIVALAINLLWLLRKAKARNGKVPVYFQLAGALLVLVPGYWLQVRFMMHAGILITFLGALLNSLPYQVYLKYSVLVAQYKNRVLAKLSRATYP